MGVAVAMCAKFFRLTPMDLPSSYRE